MVDIVGKQTPTTDHGFLAFPSKFANQGKKLGLDPW